MSGSGRGSFAIQWHYILFGLEDLNQFGSLKRILIVRSIGTKAGPSRGNLPDTSRGKNPNREDHHLQPLKLEPLLQGEGCVIVQQPREKILLLKNQLSGKEDGPRKFPGY